MLHSLDRVTLPVCITSFEINRCICRSVWKWSHAHWASSGSFEGFGFWCDLCMTNVCGSGWGSSWKAASRGIWHLWRSPKAEQRPLKWPWRWTRTERGRNPHSVFVTAGKSKQQRNEADADTLHPLSLWQANNLLKRNSSYTKHASCSHVSPLSPRAFSAVTRSWNPEVLQPALLDHRCPLPVVGCNNSAPVYHDLFPSVFPAISLVLLLDYTERAAKI